MGFLCTTTVVALLLTGPALAAQLFPGRISGRFEVSIDASQSPVFREVDGLSATVEVMEYQEGGLNDRTHKIVGTVPYTSIVLRQGALLSDLLQERLLVATDPDEIQRLQDLIARVSAADSFRVMLTNFDPRTLPDDDLFFNDVAGEVFVEDGSDTFIVTAQLPIADSPILDVIDPNNLPDSRKLKRFFNAEKDRVNGVVFTQKLGSDTPLLEFTSADPMTLDVELFFASSESRVNVKKDALKLTRKVNLLPFKLKRPPLLQLEWGTGLRFSAVIKKIDVKYTMFLQDGTPVRAKTQVQLQESRP